METTSSHYIIDEVAYDRVTEILHSYKEQWYVDWVLRVGKAAANQIGKKAMKIGGRVDELIVKELEGKAISTRKSDSKEVHSCLKGWGLFKEREANKLGPPLSWQRTHKHDATGTAGTYDLEFKDVLVDVKCATRVYKTNWLQVAWYNYISGLDKPNLGILRLDTMWNTYELVIKPANEGYLRVYEAILTAKRYFTYDGNLK